VVLTLLRMTLNTLDGVVAIQRGRCSAYGEIVNALPDRYADLVVIGGVALSPLCRDWVGLAGLCSMVLVSYSGMLGKAVGVSWQNQGPLGKVERLLILMVFSVIQYVALRGAWAPQWLGVSATPLEWAMGLYVVLGQVTVLARVRGQTREIARKEAIERLPPDRNKDRAVVIYDSATGNTRRVAEEIALGLGCAARAVQEAGDLERYTLVVLGTPNIRKRPSATMRRLQSSGQTRPPLLAVFATFGMPLWGQVSTPHCLREMSRGWNRRPVGRFACAGYHAKYRTYSGRPNEADLLSAFLFGLSLSRAMATHRGG